MGCKLVIFTVLIHRFYTAVICGYVGSCGVWEFLVTTKLAMISIWLGWIGTIHSSKATSQIIVSIFVRNLCVDLCARGHVHVITWSPTQKQVKMCWPEGHLGSLSTEFGPWVIWMQCILILLLRHMNYMYLIYKYIHLLYFEFTQ